MRVPWKGENIPYSNEHIFFSDKTTENNFYEIFNNDEEEAMKTIDKIETDILNNPIKAGRGSYIEIFGVSKNNRYLLVDYKIEKYEARHQHPI